MGLSALMGLAQQSMTGEEADVSRFLERGRYLLEQGDAGELLRELNEDRTQELARFVYTCVSSVHLYFY